MRALSSDQCVDLGTGWRAVALSLLLVLCPPAHGDDTWHHYGGSERGLQYSPHDQIDTENISDLEVAWTFRTGEMGRGTPRGYAFQANPIIVDGRLYVVTGSAIFIALRPDTGEEIWRLDARLERSVGTSETANRGVSAWRDPLSEPGSPCSTRIFLGTLDARLIALDAATGQACGGFGDGGTIRLDEDVRKVDSDWINYLVTSPPVIVDDVLVVGSAIGDDRAVELELGIVRGIDVRTGAELWRWDPLPRDSADPAHGSWDASQLARTGAANAWAPLAADSGLGLVYVPTGSASPDFYGGERLGDNRYANSIVALDAGSGEVIWHHQLVHHDVWDYDLASQPTLGMVVRDGEPVRVLIQGTKMGLVFVFDRRDGTPLFPIEERPVPQGSVPGDVLSPTQPFPVSPPPLARHDALSEDDAYGLLWFDERACAREIRSRRSEGIYTPPSVQGTLVYPFYGGGINWGGIAFDEASATAVAFSMDLAASVTLVPREDLVPMFESGEYEASEFASQTGTPYGMRREVLM